MWRFGRERGVEMFADWTDRIAKGEVPEAPPRPTAGSRAQRRLTQWEWTNNMGKVHDEVSTDKRNPRLNAHGPIYRRRDRQRLPRHPRPAEEHRRS